MLKSDRDPFYHFIYLYFEEFSDQRSFGLSTTSIFYHFLQLSKNLDFDTQQAIVYLVWPETFLTASSVSFNTPSFLGLTVEQNILLIRN